jgi:hypothetical protein
MIRNQLFILIAVFVLSCKNFYELKDQNLTRNFSEYISLPSIEKRFIEFNPSQQLQDEDSTKKELLQDKIIIQINKIEWDNILEENENNKKEIQKSLEYLIFYFLDILFKENFYILTNSNPNLNPTHLLNIKITYNEKESNKENYKFIYEVIRKNDPTIHYYFEQDCCSLHSLKENMVHIIKPSNEILIPSSSFYLTFKKENLDPLIKEINLIGKGYLNVLSLSKNKIIVKKINTKEDRNPLILFEGETPVKLQLLEGNYLIQSYKKGFPLYEQEILIKENQTQNVMIHWEDEQTSSNLNVLSNKDFAVYIDNEFKGNVPIYISELYEGNYEVQILEKNSNNILFKREIPLKSKGSLHLFYPYQYYEDFKTKFKENLKNHFWFIEKNSPNLEIDTQLKEGGFLIKENQEILTPDILLDNLRGEWIFLCEECRITFYFNQDKIVLQKLKDYLILYSGSELLKLYHIYKLNSFTPHYIYFDYNNEENKFYLYFNTQKIWEKKIDSIFLSVGFSNLMLKEFYLSEKEYKNIIYKSFYMSSKNINKLYSGNYQIR